MSAHPMRGMPSVICLPKLFGGGGKLLAKRLSGSVLILLIRPQVNARSARPLTRALFKVEERQAEGA
jgi:hypothetical protein